jgi:hypothetical protein
MSFLLYKKNSDKRILEATTTSFRLAGNNIIRKLWEEKGRPIGEGWEITASDIVKNAIPPSANSELLHPVTDFHPRTTERIGIMEIDTIYLYTFPQDRNKKEPAWTPMMLKLRSLYYEEFDPALSLEKIQEKKKHIVLPKDYDKPRDESWTFTFLYVKGESWNFGKPGSTNGTFIEGGARTYFKRYL